MTREDLVTFAQDEDGNLTFLGLFCALTMAIFGGIAVDLMASEVRRAKVQATLDRSVLAAADLENTLDPEAVVRDYFDKMQLTDADLDVVVDQEDRSKIVTASAVAAMDANFTSLLGVSGYQADALAQAQEAGVATEISMVIDISKSMWSNNRIGRTKRAARNFADIVLSEANEGLVSVSLVSYADQVDAGQDILDLLNVNQTHHFGECIEFPASAFGSTTLDRAATYEQSQQFSWNYTGYNHTYNSYCPKWSGSEISAFQSTAAGLRRDINRTWPREGTAIYNGLKWGVALLDPDFRTISAGLAAGGNISPEFANRPADFGSDTAKHLVLMSDGENSVSKRIADFAYDTEEERAFWNDTNFWHHLAWNIPAEEHDQWHYDAVTEAQGDMYTSQMCNAAKSAGITIWAVGFELSDDGAAVLENCASSANHFFRVEGDEINEAFINIGRNIVQLRLTQ